MLLAVDASDLGMNVNAVEGLWVQGSGLGILHPGSYTRPKRMYTPLWGVQLQALGQCSATPPCSPFGRTSAKNFGVRLSLAWLS